MAWLKVRIKVLLILTGVATVLLAACGLGGVKPTPTLAGVEVDPVFREFYNRLGGQAVMGLALLQAEEKNGILNQYTEAGLMVYDPKAPSAQQYSLAPLGRKLNLQAPQGDLPPQEGALIVDGVVVYSKFVDLYKLLDMTRFAGHPLSQPMADAEAGRIVQYFENVGFYTSLNDPKDGVHLLSYGGVDCAGRCQYQPQPLNSPLTRPVYDEPFLDSLKRIGLDLVGRPLSAYYRTPDGMIEQIYDNVVIYAPADNLRLVSLRPLPILTGFPPSPAVVKNTAVGLVFIPVPIDNSLGHNVAQVFEQYISNHGGGIFAGSPISEIFTVGSLYRQCFTNYCLDYDSSLPVNARIHPADLGKIYLKMNPPDQQAIKRLTLSPETVLLKTGEKKAAISITENQQISLKVVQREDQSPIPNLAATLTLSLPDGQQLVYSIEATDGLGNSQVTIDPILAANGSIIPYQVCLNISTGSPICTDDSFAIWTP
jgi:hypothetical protein